MGLQNTNILFITTFRNESQIVPTETDTIKPK